ncbi:hypothetical protein [Nonomuraea sp. NPDC002799]
MAEDSPLLPSLLTLSDVLGTGHHGAVTAGVTRGDRVLVIDGGTISRLGGPQYEQGPVGADLIMRNITLTGGVSPARAYIEELMPDILDGTIDPGRVFDRTAGLDDVPGAYRDMAERRALKVLIRN